MDDPAGAGQGLGPPRPVEPELIGHDREAERAIRSRLEALDPDRHPEQSEVGLAETLGATGRPGRPGRPEIQLRKETGECRRLVQRGPHEPRRCPDIDPSLERPARFRSPLLAPLPPDPDRHRQTPTGGQTVFISRKAAIHSGRSVARSSSQSNRASVTPAGRRERRLTLSAATSSTSVLRASGTPQTPIASTPPGPAMTC